MRAVIQRVRSASVVAAAERIAAIGPGLLILLGIEATDSADDIEWLAAKVAGLKLFPDEGGPWRRSVVESGGEALVVSQFTLLASTRKGVRPSWHRAAKPDVAAPLCESFARRLQTLLPGRVETGRFGAMMDVSLINDGPVTLVLDSRQRE
jgi:D-tyrosyl-tRNA(Tyr) deacylase